MDRKNFDKDLNKASLKTTTDAAAKARMITNKEAINAKMTVKDLLKARGINDPKGYLDKTALSEGYNLNKTIEEFKGYERIKELYQRPIIIEEQNILDDLGQAATIAVLAAVVLVVVAPYVMKGDAVMQKVQKAVINEINASLKENVI